MIKLLHRLSDIIYVLSGYVITGFLFLITIFTFVQVVSRFVFRFPIAWSQELIVYLLIWLVFIGCSMGLRNGEVASLTLGTDRLSPRARKMLRIVVNVILVAFFMITTISNAELIEFASRRRSSIMRINMAFVSSAYSVSSVIMAYNCTLAVIDDIKYLVKGPSVK